MEFFANSNNYTVGDTVQHLCIQKQQIFYVLIIAPFPVFDKKTLNILCPKVVFFYKKPTTFKKWYKTEYIIKSDILHVYIFIEEDSVPKIKGFSYLSQATFH